MLEYNIEKIATYDFENKKIFGSAYWVYQKGNVVYQKCFGTTSPEAESLVTVHTIFRLASMTKPVTADHVGLFTQCSDETGKNQRICKDNFRHGV